MRKSLRYLYSINTTSNDEKKPEDIIGNQGNWKPATTKEVTMENHEQKKPEITMEKSLNDGKSLWKITMENHCGKITMENH